MAPRDDSGRVVTGRSTATISVAQTAPIRVHHLTEVLCGDERGLRRSLPEAAARVLRLTSGRSADAAAIEAALAADPGLTGPLLSLSTSLTGARDGVPSVRGAIIELGLEGTRDALLVIVLNGISASVPGFEARAEGLRRRALAAALAARFLARALTIESGHDFLVGLLHDVGEIVLLQRAAEEGILPAGIFDDPKTGPIVLEAIENDHARLGGALCRAWGLPLAVADAAEHHHERRPGGRARLPAQLAAASDVIAMHPLGAPAGDVASHPAFAELGVPRAAVETVIREVAAALPSLVAGRSSP